ncbi:MULTISPECIES: PulJ/GspJ family protein [Sphingomonadales]|jgi:general secretion pathway protein J|uniref:General secretion pathway protein J n=2 Tax=Sphingomonadaceae TaxID=41297 RepID=A0A397PIK8_9SPHN|nr:MULTISPECIES: prepilin-type N-terminal cleavage/methylation domain-containing protein [Sphingomonadaceae]EKU73396.1 prepilin-type N-terminal cleavage/methylation domain-containing protein [Sphingobium yanoikuyae ATCC 51230]RIA45974.1 general secretion pathway protein J [Hephaestia caeni]WQE08182.1 prepilin-type N-terminal cleavage/methylation domain-containing protein [Sphingobium yanoikuyae]
MAEWRYIDDHQFEREGGFTLIELLVSLALMGLAATLLLQGLTTAGILAGRSRATINAVDEVVAAQNLLRSAVERLRPITRSDSAIPIVELRGTGGVLTFVGPPFDREGADALQRFRLTRTANGDLVLYSAHSRKMGIDRSGTDLVGWTPNRLLTGVRNLSISYLGPPEPGAPRAWQDRWWDRSTTPELIRVRVVFAETDRRIWPDLVIRPRSTSYGTCRNDPVTGKCEER